MFNISFLVSDAKLADTLTRLQSVIPGGVEVLHMGGQAQLQPTTQQASTPKPKPSHPVKVKAHQRNYLGRHSGPNSQVSRTQAIINTIGVGPFPVAQLIEQGGKLGIGKPAIYRAIRAELDAGNLAKIEPGLYQRTGASFAKGVVAGATRQSRLGLAQ